MTETKQSLNFLEQIIEEDIRAGKHNDCPHIGHAKSICSHHGLAKQEVFGNPSIGTLLSLSGLSLSGLSLSGAPDIL